MAAGDYVVKKRDTSSMRAATVHLDRGDDRVLYDRHMHEVPVIQLAKKGGWGIWHAAAGAGQYVSGMGPQGPLYLGLGADLATMYWSYAGRLILSMGSEERNGVSTQSDLVGVQMSALRTGALGPLTWGAGPMAGLLYVQQQTRGQPAVAGVTGLVGGRTTASTPLVSWLSAAFTVDVGAQMFRTLDPAPRLGLNVGEFALVPWFAYGAELRVSF
jgi:hypothetical protein